MPKNTDIKSILVIGAGPIIIGQACEFDYSGTQACKALKEEGFRVILINSNPATIMTDPSLADATYIEPITPEFVEKIIIQEKPDAILPTVGGQTALNCALKLAKNGILAKYNIKLIGANEESIEKAEDRRLFNEAMQKIGLSCPKNYIVNHQNQLKEALNHVGLPAIIRPSFTLGGTGGGIAYTEEEFKQKLLHALEISPVGEALVDESIIGWKEYEMEAIRDKNDNVIIICAIENIDPIGIHTGDSITVTPAMTLTDKEYQNMRNATIAVLREIGVDTGGSNVQFAVDPVDGRMVVIEMNPRVSRSSALASKATGFPIAKVAAKLAVGYTLDEILNDCTKTTLAAFEPTIDYIVVKIPRFAFEKFTTSNKELSTAMKSVGETMAIGRSFSEALQKAIRSLETGLSGLDETEYHNKSTEIIIEQLKKFSYDRVMVIADALRANISLEEIHRHTYYDPWFIKQISNIVDFEKNIQNISYLDPNTLFKAKNMGFSDKRIAKLRNIDEYEVFVLRQESSIHPVYKRIDTCAAEFEAHTAYMYSSYEAQNIVDTECEANISAQKKIIIIGSGPNRIGQGIEFDYACVHASYALKDAGYETIMVNCNPETVSTDYDTSDRLYFEPVTFEDVYEIVIKEQEKGELLGVIVQLGGQTPLKLCQKFTALNVPILGTLAEAIDIAEDREKFKEIIKDLNIKQPANYICNNSNELLEKISHTGYPAVVRPSYVLGGSSMVIVNSLEELKEYLVTYSSLFDTGPVLVDSFLQNAMEFDVDALADGEDVVIASITEHVEEAGIHSGDSACIIPPQSISEDIIKQISETTVAIAKALKIIGLINIQYALKDNVVYILEVNPRASRTVPFVAKATGVEIAKIASLIMTGKKIIDFNLSNNLYSKLKHVAVKEAVFSFAKFDNADTILGPEMRSTGETMGISYNFAISYAKAQIATNVPLPSNGTVFISVKSDDKHDIIPIAEELTKYGFDIIATSGTYDILQKNNIKASKINKVREGSPHIVDMMEKNKINFVINTTAGKQSIIDSFSIRRTALIKNITYSTDINSTKCLIQAIKALKDDNDFQVRSIQDYLKNI